MLRRHTARVQLLLHVRWQLLHELLTVVVRHLAKGLRVGPLLYQRAPNTLSVNRAG